VRPVRRRSEVAEVIALEISSTSTLEHRSEDAPTAAANYLESQSEGSRRVVLLRLRQVLAVVLERIPTAREALSFPFERLTVDHVALISRGLIATKAPSTASAAITALRGVLRVCWLQQRIDGESYHRLVASCIRVRGERLPRGRALDVDEVSRMHRVASTRDRAMLALLFGAGMRRSEAAAVTWDMIQGDELRVIGKGNKQRAVPLPRWALEALEAHRIEVSKSETPGARRRRYRFLAGNVLEGLSSDGVYYALGALATRAKVTRCSPHDGRRTYLSELLDVTDMRTVAALGGHSDLNQTARYDRRGERTRREAVNRLRDVR
jgi:integrase/recombinase XerD